MWPAKRQGQGAVASGRAGADAPALPWLLAAQRGEGVSQRVFDAGLDAGVDLDDLLQRLGRGVPVPGDRVQVAKDGKGLVDSGLGLGDLDGVVVPGPVSRQRAKL